MCRKASTCILSSSDSATMLSLSRSRQVRDAVAMHVSIHPSMVGKGRETYEHQPLLQGSLAPMPPSFAQSCSTPGCVAARACGARGFRGPGASPRQRWGLLCWCLGRRHRKRTRTGSGTWCFARTWGVVCGGGCAGGKVSVEAVFGDRRFRRRGGRWGGCGEGRG